MTALHRAVALSERQDAAVVQSEDLHLDVPGTLQVTLEQDVGRAVQPLGPALGTGEDRAQRRVVVHRAHANAAPTGAGLDHQRVAEPLGGGQGGVDAR